MSGTKHKGEELHMTTEEEKEAITPTTLEAREDI